MAKMPSLTCFSRQEQNSLCVSQKLFTVYPHHCFCTLLTPTPQDRYLNTIQTVAPHLLRYLAVAVIINKRRRNVLKDLIRVGSTRVV